MKKTRLDLLLVDRGLFLSREKARRAIMAGGVLVDNRLQDKPGKTVLKECEIKIVDRPKYVSRGGEKLEAALMKFGLRVSGKKCLDIGSSTGGFTDCLLQHGADKVTSVDVGYGQLDTKLRSDHRVMVKERLNARRLKRSDLIYPPELVTIDVSFISLKLILPAVMGVTDRGAGILALIKPQFEAGPKDVGRGGVVRDSRVHTRVLWDICMFSEDKGFIIKGLMESPLRGPAGNKEFFIYLTRP